MIVDPDFPDHWKTKLLIGSLDGDAAAPVYVLRLWAHCQNRRKSEFDPMTSEALKALCCFPGQANRLESSLAASGFIRREGSRLIVIGWSEYNASLFAAWNNGRKGGRKPAEEPPGIPGANDKRREDKSREEKKKKPLPLFSFPVELQSKEFSEAWADWLQHRTEIRKPLKPTAADKMLKKLALIGHNKAVAAINHSIANGWQGVYEPQVDSFGKYSGSSPQCGPNSWDKIDESMKELKAEEHKKGKENPL